MDNKVVLKKTSRVLARTTLDTVTRPFQPAG